MLGAFAALPVLTVFAYGCESPTQFDDLCNWLKDPDNCYRDYFIDIGARCGAAGTTVPGSFVSREALDLCILDGGGQVIFDPPISLEAPPPTTEPIKIKMINPDATECGVIEFRAKYDFSVTINGDPIDPGVDPNTLPDEVVIGGTFDMKGGKDSDILNVSCASGAVFKFDRLQVTRCTEVEDILPHAEIDFSAGGTEQIGVVRVNVFYPPTEGDLEGAAPIPINYVECFIPAAPPVCENGKKDGAETDIDCGGSFCASRCLDGQSCVNNDDCASNVCALDMGIKKCQGP
ncbi:MAG: hypothetical protein U0271_39620 [Polyangiaceae bacterium]